MTERPVMNDSAHDMAIKAGPGLLVWLWHSVNSSLPIIILWATAIYTVAQAYLALRKIFRREK